LSEQIAQHLTDVQQWVRPAQDERRSDLKQPLSSQDVTCTFPAEAVQLLFSSLSLTAFFTSSAQASIKYWPRAVLLGIVTLVPAPEEAAPGASAGTGRLPVRSLSPAFLDPSAER
jgi:hypothetical protein